MNIEIKQLDQRLIEIANMHSFGGKRGDIDAHEYEVYSHPDEVPNPICEHECQIVR